MTYQSKAALREEIAELHQLRLRLGDAENTLDSLGYEKRGDPIRPYWRKPLPTERDIREQEALFDASYNSGRTAGVEAALKLVLQGLAIPSYNTSHVSDINRFQADLETALRVRAEKKQAAEDAATEARVATLATKSKGDKK